jgi:hypothetical protein
MIATVNSSRLVRRGRLIRELFFSVCIKAVYRRCGYLKQSDMLDPLDMEISPEIDNSIHNPSCMMAEIRNPFPDTTLMGLLS